MKKKRTDLWIGFLLGSTMSVPGVSGGTMALALGYYNPILNAASHLRRKGSLPFLLRILCGGLAGFLLGASLLNYMLNLVPITVTVLFLGAVGTGIFLFSRETLKKGIGIGEIFCLLLGLAAVLVIDNLPQNAGTQTPFLSLLWGILLSVGLILPGISTSHLLTVFGLYGVVTDFSSENILRLFPLGFGVFLGILLLTKPLAIALERWEGACNCLLLGFAVGSLKGLAEPCFDSPQIDFIPLFQTVSGILLAIGACLLILKCKNGK